MPFANRIQNMHNFKLFWEDSMITHFVSPLLYCLLRVAPAALQLPIFPQLGFSVAGVCSGHNVVGARTELPQQAGQQGEPPLRTSLQRGARAATAKLWRAASAELACGSLATLRGGYTWGPQERFLRVIRAFWCPLRLVIKLRRLSTCGSLWRQKDECLPRTSNRKISSSPNCKLYSEL